MQFVFRFQIFLFSIRVRFSTKTLVYLAHKTYKAFMAFKTYKAFMALKRSRLNPFQKYHLITPFSVDWPRTRKNLLVCHVTRPCPCMTLSITIKITHVTSMWIPSPSLDHSKLSWCWGPNDLWVLLHSFYGAYTKCKPRYVMIEDIYSWLDLSRWTERLSRGLLSSNMGSSLCSAKLPEFQSFRKQLFTGTFFILNFCLYHMLSKKITWPVFEVHARIKFWLNCRIPCHPWHYMSCNTNRINNF